MQSRKTPATAHDNATAGASKRPGRLALNRQARTVTAVGALVSLPLTAMPAMAAIVPVAQPHHIEVFPNIDMAGAHGFTEPFVMEVWRNGVKVGSSGAPSTADPLELNHDGPPCWHGTTPDIIPGDQIRVVNADTIDLPEAEQVGEYMTVANIDAEPAKKVALDADGIQNDVVMTGTASTLDGSAALDLTHLSAEIVQPAWRDNGWRGRAIGAVPGVPIPNATTPFPDRGDGALFYEPVSETNPLGNHWTAVWKNMAEPFATLALSGEHSISYFEIDDGLEGSGLTIMDAEDASGPGIGCPPATSDAVTGTTPTAANIAFVNGSNALIVNGTADNAAGVSVTLDDSDGVSTDAVTVEATLTNPASTAETTAPVAPLRQQTWRASFPNEAFDALSDGDLSITGVFQKVIEATEQRTDETTGGTTTVYTHNTRAMPGRAHVLVKDTVAPLAPEAFPAPGRYTSAQAVTIIPDNELDDTVRYRPGNGTQADPTAASPIAPVPYQVTSTQTIKARSFDSAGNGSPTASLAYTIAANSVPAAPANPPAVTPGNGQATVSWTSPTDDGGSPITGAVVDIFEGSAYLRSATYNTTATSVVVTGLTNGTAYSFRVRASNAIGAGPASPASQLVTPVAPVPLTAPTVTPASGSYTTAQSVAMTAPAGTQIRYTVGAGTTVPANPTATTGTVYTGPVNVAASQVLKAVAVNTANGLVSAVTQRNYTISSGDVVAPTVTARTPAVAALTVGTGGNITATLSEGVQGVSGTSFTLRTPTNALVPAAVTYNATTRVATLNPTANLAADTRYTATLTGGAAAIRDLAGNPLAIVSWTFTTGPAPTVTARTPAINGTGFARGANATVTFSENVQAVSGTTVRLTNAGTAAAVTAAVTYNATTRVATINPNANLAANTLYRVTLTGGATGIRDIAGNPLGAGVTLTWTFRTGA